MQNPHHRLAFMALMGYIRYKSGLEIGGRACVLVLVQRYDPKIFSRRQRDCAFSLSKWGAFFFRFFDRGSACFPGQPGIAVRRTPAVVLPDNPLSLCLLTLPPRIKPLSPATG